jgi:hypothetical protein
MKRSVNFRAGRGLGAGLSAVNLNNSVAVDGFFLMTHDANFDWQKTVENYPMKTSKSQPFIGKFRPFPKVLKTFLKVLKT